MTKRIALVYDCIYPYTKGGGEKRYYEIAKRLAIKGHEVHLYGMKFWEGQDVLQKEGLYLHGICPPKPLYTKDGRRSIRQAVFFGIHCLKLIKENFDIIDCCSFPYFSLFTCKFVCLLKGKKLHSTWHEVWGKKYWRSYLGVLGYIASSIEKFSVFLPDKIISVSEHTTKKLKNDLSSKKDIITVLDGVDVDYIQKIKPSPVKSDVIFAGRLLSHKNVDVLIKSIAILKKSHRNVKCFIIGDGPERTRLEKMVATLHLTRNVVFLGFLENHDEVYSLIKSSKVSVLPSSREGFGMVLVEANACGIPVITVKNKDNAAKDLIEEIKNGYVCRLGEKEIAEKIIKIVKNNTNEEMRQRCLDSAMKYDWNEIVNKIEKVYQE
ncbi:MAG TPA: glycosyltransferase family 4 protein [Patescibacteria group bacterium]|nr:glycosyltransferase family 4 protein [Patescibacteria group bacterium]